MARDDFDKPDLGLEWNFLRTPREQWWSLTARPGSLLLQPRPVPLHSVENKNLTANRNPSFLGRRVQHLDFSATTTLHVTPTTEDGEAGLAALQHNENYFFLGVRTTSGYARQIFLERSARGSSERETVAIAPLPENATQIDLRMTGKGTDYTFDYRVAAGKWLTLKEHADGSMLERGGSNFIGTYIGLYARTRPGDAPASAP